MRHVIKKFPDHIANSLTFPWLFQVYKIPWQFQVFKVFQVCGNPVTAQSIVNKQLTGQWRNYITSQHWRMHTHALLAKNIKKLIAIISGVWSGEGAFIFICLSQRITISSDCWQWQQYAAAQGHSHFTREKRKHHVSELWHSNISVEFQHHRGQRITAQWQQHVPLTSVRTLIRKLKKKT